VEHTNIAEISLPTVCKCKIQITSDAKIFSFFCVIILLFDAYKKSTNK